MGLITKVLLLSVAIVTLINGITSTELQVDPCAKFNTCVTCTDAPAGICGWCAATETCMEGSAFGPANGAKCLVTWEYGQCHHCENLQTCRDCLNFPGDCFYCQNGNGGKGSCHHIGNPAPVGCAKTDTCQCAQYSTCGECLGHGSSLCAWCPQTGLCSPVTSNTTGCVTDKCPCNKYHTCTACKADDGCDWCIDGGIPSCTNMDNSTCLRRALSCEKFCEEAQDCSSCMQRSVDCGWCSSMRKCIDIDIVGCDEGVAHTCPTDPKQCNVRNSCQACTGIPGDPCAWCPSSNSCIDINFQGDQCPESDRVGDSQKCHVPFAGGAFVGGMFLVIGVLVLGAVGYFLFMRFRGQRASYSVVNN